MTKEWEGAILDIYMNTNRKKEILEEREQQQPFAGGWWARWWCRCGFFKGARWADTNPDFYNLADKLYKPSHDNNTGLFTKSLAAKLKYMETNKFNSYEEEVQWIADYLKEHWND